jgi:predicted hydrocarbon binding protein
MEDSIFMKAQRRKHIGDYCHIGVIQQPLTALKWIDPFCGTLLYSAGFELGIYGPGKEIIWKAMLDLKKEWPLDLPDAVKVITAFLAHPQTILSRQHAFVQLMESNSKRALIQIKDCATTSGLPTFDQGEQFCDFQAGYIGGRIDLLMERDVIVRELECHGTGHKHCLFEIVHV